MKKLALTLLAIGGVFTACQQDGKQTQNIVIQGQLPQDVDLKAYENKYVYLAEGYTEAEHLDSAKIEGGKFRFERSVVDSIDYAYVYIPDTYSANLFLEPGTIKVDFMKDWAEGTPLNEGMRKYYAECEKESVESRKLIDTYYEKYQEGDDALDSLVSGAVYHLQAKHGIIAEKVLREHPNDALGVRMLVDLLALDIIQPDDIERWQGIIGDYVRGHKVIAPQLLKFDAVRLTAEGKAYTDFEGKTATGEAVKFSKYVGQGHYTLVDFWASWCGPCRAEFPNLKKIYAKYKPLGLEIVGIAVSDAVEDHTKAVKEEGITWPQIISEKEAADLYGIRGIPHIMLVDPQGKIVARDLRGEAIEQALEDAKAKNGGKL